MWQPNVASDVEPDCSCTRLVYNTGADNTYTLLLGVWYAAGFVGETVKCLNQRQLTWYAEWRCREFVKWRKRITFTEERKREVDTLRKKVVLESWVCCERCQDGPLMLKSYPLCFHLFLTHTHTRAYYYPQVHKHSHWHYWALALGINVWKYLETEGGRCLNQCHSSLPLAQFTSCSSSHNPLPHPLCLTNKRNVRTRSQRNHWVNENRWSKVL